jgi:hypothetical protein
MFLGIYQAGYAMITIPAPPFPPPPGILGDV